MLNYQRVLGIPASVWPVIIFNKPSSIRYYWNTHQTNHPTWVCEELSPLKLLNLEIPQVVNFPLGKNDAKPYWNFVGQLLDWFINDLESHYNWVIKGMLTSELTAWPISEYRIVSTHLLLDSTVTLNESPCRTGRTGRTGGLAVQPSLQRNIPVILKKTHGSTWIMILIYKR